MQQLTIWLNFRTLILLLLMIGIRNVSGQLTLDSAYAAAKRNYPLIRQKDLIRQTKDLTIENLRKAFLPQVGVSGQATYQSDVTSVEVLIPGVKIEPPSKDQYKVLAEISQLIYDGGQTRHQQQLQELNATVENQKIEVELYKLEERVNQLFLGILYLDEQIKQVSLIQQDINTGIRRVDAQVQNGVAFRSNLLVLQAELLGTNQRLIEIKAGRKALLDVLSLFVGASLNDNTVLVRPAVTADLNPTVSRPELKLYTEQSRLLDHRHKIIRSGNLPRTSLFLQGGVGRPGLNMLKNEFDMFYIGGVRFSWSLSGLYTRKRDRELVEVSKRVVDVQKETFVFNINAQLRQQQSEVDKLKQLVETDDEIIELRARIKDAARAQLENGVITSNDYLREVNAEDQARQTRITHQLQLLQAQINYINITGRTTTTENEK